MAGGTSPSITALLGSNNGFGIAFQANTGHLFVYNALDNSHADSNLGMASGTSPSTLS